jgi:hypothetical protein
MSDATNPGDIVVTGQRRQANGSFPNRGGGRGTGGPVQQERPEDQPETVGLPDPCSAPLSKAVWDADAAAAAAVASMMAAAAAAGGSFADREVLTTIYREPGTGRIRTLPPQVGNAVDPNCVPAPGQDCFAGITPTYPPYVGYDNWMGEIHSHPWSTVFSQADRDSHMGFVNTIRANFTDRANEIRYLASYIVKLDSTAPRGYRIYANDETTQVGQIGREVNPDAQPCP